MAKKRHLHKRFLAPQARRGDGHGYLNQPDRQLTGTSFHVDEPDTIAKIASATAMCDEPEVVDPTEFTALALRINQLRRLRAIEDAREGRKLMTPEQRVASARTRAKDQRCDISHDLHIIEKALERARRGGRQAPASVIQRLEAVELFLDKPPELKAA